MATGLFDDLIPTAPTNTTGAFNDLIPASGLRARNPEQIALEEELQRPTPERLGLRAALGLGEEGKGALRVATGNVVDTLGKIVRSHPMVREMERITKTRDPVSTYVQAIGQETAEEGRRNVAEARELGEGVGGGPIGNTIQALGTTFTVSAPAIPAALLGGLPAAAITAGATQYGSSLDQFKQQLIQRGNTPEEAERKSQVPAALAGTITATLTRAIPGGAEMLLNRVAAGETAQGVGRFLGNILKRQIPLEVGEEGLDQMGQSVVEYLMVNPDKTLEEAVKETIFAMGAAGALTGIVGGVTAGTMKAAESAGTAAEDVAFRRRSRRIADYQAREGFRPLGRTSTSERTYDTQTERQIPVTQPQGQVAGGIPIQESGAEARTTGPILEAPQQVAAQSGWTFNPVTQSGGVNLTGLPPELAAQLPPPQWEFTDRRPDSPTQGFTVYVPEGSTLEQGLAAINAKRQEVLQGERRSPQEATVEGRQPVPVAPPAIQFTGLSIPVEQAPIAERIKDKVTEENVAAPGLPIRNINIVKSGPTDPAIYTVPSSGGFDTVNVDLEKLGRSLQAEGLDIDQYLALATNEEIIHNAAGAVAHDRWVKFGREKAAFPEFYRRQMAVIHEEMTPEQRVQVRQVYGVAGLDMSPERVAEEHLRMLVQGRLKGGITEQTIGTQTLDFLKALFKRLMEILGVTQDAQKQQIIRGYADAVQAVIQQAEARAPGERFAVDEDVEPSGAVSPSLPTLRWNPDQSQDGFGLLGVAALNNPAAEPLKMGGRINPQQLVNRLRTILPAQEMQWYAEKGLFNLANNPNATVQDFINFMQQNGPKVETVKLSATDLFNDNAVGEFENLSHELEVLGFRYNNMGRITRVGSDITWERTNPNFPPEARRIAQRLDELLPEYEEASTRATDSATARYTMVNPKPLDQMPGAVDILVRVPTPTTERGTIIGRDSILFRGPHFGSSDVNVLASIRGYMETLPNGKKTFHIFEVQSDWGQDKRSHQENPGEGGQYKADHPLLRDYNRLAIKAAIKHAIDNGADSITISDAETAMLTEGHDRSATQQLVDASGNAILQGPNPPPGAKWTKVVPQERGMRLNYDQVLPKIAQELTGFGGVHVDFGEHQNSFFHSTPPPEGRLRTDLIFRNPDGTPKTSITGREFDLTATKQRLNQTGGVFPLFGSGKFVAENPFDRMRRESGAVSTPATPEQSAARERNEQRRTMRPNPRFAGAIDPAAQLAVENDDDLFIETKVMGVTDTVNGRPMNTQASTDASKVWAGERIKEAGLDAVRDDAVGGWRFTGGENHEGGRRLVQIIEREFAVPDSPDRDNATLLASLINSVRVNYDAGVLDNIVDEATGIRLYALTQGEASHRGRALQALAMHPVTIELVGRHVPAHLQKVYSNAFGGEVIEGVMADIRRGTQAFMTRPLIEHVLAQNPRLQNALDLAMAVEEKALPDAIELIQQVFQTPFYKLADFGKALERRLIKEYGVDPKTAATIAKEFQAAFDPSLKQGANEALKIATANITYEKKAKVKGKKPIEKLVQDAINKGALESGQVLRDIAKQQGWNPPSDAEIDRMKRLADRLTELRQLPAATLAEMRKTNASEADIENARAVREAGLSSEINRIRKELEIAWARMTKPINFFLGLPFFGDPTIRANNARAINEFIAANLLSKPGFFTRQVAAILSQWLSFVPTRSIANAIVNNQHAKDWKERQPFIKEVASQLRDGYKQQFASMKSAIAGAQAGLLGRGEQRTVLNLTSALSALDRLTKQAEERWAAGDYGRASLLYFLSSIKLGYRIAQGLDRLQGVPAHYQNMRAQIVRALMDKGKTRAEADTSADLVLGDMKGQWMLATARARDLLVEADVEPTAQKIRQNAAQIVKRWAYQKVAESGLDADAFEAENAYLENTLGWNQREVKGLGGALARGLRQAERVAESYGIPLVATRFSNAIGITINRSLAYTPLWKQANVGGPGDSAWFKSEVDRAQRRVEAIVGTSVGAIALIMALTGTWAVRLRWPKDKEERDLFEREGHRPNTVEVPVGETEFLAISLNNSPLMFVAPYLAAGAALREKLEEKSKLQASRDKQAAELGVTAEKVPGLSAADLTLVALAAAQQAVMGGRTVAGLIGSMTSYGTPNAKKTVSSYASAMIPWLPAAQEGSRMAGVALDEKAASIGDLMLPLPTSGARKLNLLGDPVRTPNDIQRISQILTGGTSLVPVNTADARTEAAYRALIESGFRPPSVSPGQGYLIDGQIRPMNGGELQRYTAARGARLKEALAGFSATGDTEADKKQARQLYQAANTQALTEIGATTIPRYSSGSASPPSLPKPRVTRPRSGLRRTRGVRIRSARVRRIRPVRAGRRTRNIRRVRLAA